MTHEVRIVRTAATPLAVVRRRARQDQLSAVVPQACGLVWSVVKQLALKGAGRHVAVYRGHAEGLLDVEVGVELAAPFGGSGEVFDSTTPAGDAATVTHLGPYGGLGGAHQALRDWCAANGRTPTGVSWEVYGHWLPEWDADPSRIRTDVFYLLGPTATSA
jgi:effector-binding domain-containing protein